MSLFRNLPKISEDSEIFGRFRKFSEIFGTFLTLSSKSQVDMVTQPWVKLDPSTDTLKNIFPKRVRWFGVYLRSKKNEIANLGRIFGRKVVRFSERISEFPKNSENLCMHPTTGQSSIFSRPKAFRKQTLHCFDVCTLAPFWSCLINLDEAQCVCSAEVCPKVLRPAPQPLP